MFAEWVCRVFGLQRDECQLTVGFRTLFGHRPPDRETSRTEPYSVEREDRLRQPRSSKRPLHSGARSFAQHRQHPSASRGGRPHNGTDREAEGVRLGKRISASSGISRWAARRSDRHWGWLRSAIVERKGKGPPSYRASREYRFSVAVLFCSSYTTHAALLAARVAGMRRI
jgi:hypothetical protein